MTSTKYPSVVVVGGVEPGRVLVIDEVLNDFSLGSDEGCHLVLSGAQVSPVHASLLIADEGRVILSDTRSRSGVFVNGTKVIEHTLADGDEISIGPPDDPGSVRLHFVAPGSEAPLIDRSGSGAGGLTGLEGLERSESSEPAFAADASGLEDLDGGLQELTLTPSPTEAAPSMVDEFPPREMLSEMEPLPAPGSDPSLSAPVDAAHRRVSKPVAAKEATATGPQPSAPAPEAAKASSARRLAPKKIASEDADDPLPDQAQPLGGARGERFKPPPAPVVAPRKTGARSATMATRLAVIAVVIGGLAWFAVREYSESIVVPVVDAYLPNPAEPGQTVTINGSGFGNDPDPISVKVTLGQLEAQVLDVTPTRINIRVPESLGASGSQTLPLQVTPRGTTSIRRLLKIAVAPRITSLTPRVALSGEEVEIAGRWLANSKTKPTVTVAGAEAEVLEATPGRIRIKIPEVAAREGQKVSVRVAVGSDVGKEAPLNFGRLPFVESVSPARAWPGEIATIVGLGLSGADLSVRVGGKSAAVLSVTDAEIRISVPGLRLSESAGQRDLSVQVNQKTSLLHPIDILRESSALYLPRFFVELREGSRVVLSCELGPVMVLGSDALSLKRALDAAARLNALASEGRASRILFTASELVISAPGGPVLMVMAGDGTGNPRSLAGLWAAQLTDMFDLFLQGRRPGRTVELSPDGTVFLDIFAAARRRSTEPGVAMGVLFSPDPAWLRSLASLATAPTMDGSQATALLDGYWAGALEAPGASPARKIEISLTATPSGLVGQRTSRQGGLSTDVTLQDLAYARRELRFSFVLSGESLNYLGRLDGDAIEGNVTKASGARVGKLIFKLTR